MGANITCYDAYGETLSHVYQWNSNTEIHIDGIPIDRGDVVFHFCNRLSENALIVEPSVDENEQYVAAIPNELLMQPDNIILYIFATRDGNISETISQIRIPMIPRVKPSDYNDTQSGVNGASNPELTRVGTNSEVMGETIVFPETEAMMMRIQEDRLNLLKANKTDEIDTQKVVQ